APCARSSCPRARPAARATSCTRTAPVIWRWAWRSTSRRCPRPNYGPDPELIALAIHGGAGAMPRRKMTPAVAARYKAGLARALEAGHAVLVRNGTAVDAVCAAVVALEDSPLFNAGRGACYNTDEKHELDASVMDGATLRAGAVAAVSRIRSPVLAARAVMEKSHH